MKNGIRTILLPLGDIVMLVTAFFIMLELAFSTKISQKIIISHFLPFSFVFCIWLFVFFLFNLYETPSIKPTIPNLRKIGIASVVSLSVSIILFYIIPSFGIAPKTNLMIFSSVFVLLFIVWRRSFYNIFSKYFLKEIIFVADKNKSCLEEIINHIKTCPQSGFTIGGIYSSLEQFSLEHWDTNSKIFIVSKDIWHNAENFKKLYNTKSEMLDLACAYEKIMNRIPIDAIDESWFIHNIHKDNNHVFDLMKRFLSLFAIILMLVAISPLLLIIAILIKLQDRGPILYSQTRVGKDGKNFNLYKFRSMIVNSEKNGPEWSKKEDPRITPIGKIIRKLHIDEIPQMFNIIKGDIALVGPRPERPEFVKKLEKEIPFYHLRHIITPGFTGWAQIKFRYAGNVIDSKEKFEYDLYYLKNRNIFMDLGIILRTIQIIFTH